MLRLVLLALIWVSDSDTLNSTTVDNKTIHLIRTVHKVEERAFKPYLLPVNTCLVAEDRLKSEGLTTLVDDA
jgi:hypothetical protein